LGERYEKAPHKGAPSFIGNSTLLHGSACGGRREKYYRRATPRGEKVLRNEAKKKAVKQALSSRSRSEEQKLEKDGRQRVSGEHKGKQTKRGL